MNARRRKVNKPTSPFYIDKRRRAIYAKYSNFTLHVLNRTHRRRVRIAADPKNQRSDRANKIKIGFSQLDPQYRICFCLVLCALRYDTNDYLEYRLYCPCRPCRFYRC